MHLVKNNLLETNPLNIHRVTIWGLEEWLLPLTAPLGPARWV